jgi:hypothetical protein
MRTPSRATARRQEQRRRASDGRETRPDADGLAWPEPHDQERQLGASDSPETRADEDTLVPQTDDRNDDHSRATARRCAPTRTSSRGPSLTTRNDDHARATARRRSAVLSLRVRRPEDRSNGDARATARRNAQTRRASRGLSLMTRDDDHARPTARRLSALRTPSCATARRQEQRRRASDGPETRPDADGLAWPEPHDQERQLGATDGPKTRRNGHAPACLGPTTGTTTTAERRLENAPRGGHPGVPKPDVRGLRRRPPASRDRRPQAGEASPPASRARRLPSASGSATTHRERPQPGSPS